METIQELKFEYKFVTRYEILEKIAEQNLLKHKTNYSDVLNELGKDGWELVSVLQYSENSTYIFKRAKWEEKKAQEKQEDNANKIERKFKVGDWIVENGVNRNPVQITAFEEDKGVGIKVWFSNGTGTYIEFLKGCHKWTIQDAKDGDILSYENEVFIVKKSVNLNILYYCCYDGEHFIIDSFYSLTIDDIYNIRPATKEQRNLLFQKMKESEYEWDTDKKELQKIDNHATWSEDDENNLTDTCVAIRKFYHGTNGAQELIDWLQVIKQRIKGE